MGKSGVRSVEPRGADLVVRALRNAGTRHVFSLSGNQIMPIYDALVDENVNLYHVRHEAAAVHMADAWGRLTGRPGVALVTAGPGFANTLSALYVARMAESPVVLISGSSAIAEAGQGAFQEMPQARMAEPVTKASWTASGTSGLSSEIERAYEVAASGRTGPVHVTIPVDALEARVPADEERPSSEAGAVPGGVLDDATAARFFDLVRGAKRPLIIAGPAASRGESRQAIDELADTADVPAAYMESPRGVADPSLGAFAEVLPEADLVVLIGKKLDFMLKFGGEPTFSRDCKFVQIDAEESAVAATEVVLGDAGRLALKIVADPDPASASRRLLAHASAFRPQHSGWADEVRDAIAFRPRSWQDLEPDENGALHPVQVCREIQKLLGDGGVFVSDGGEFGQWAQACINAPERLINGPSGAIGSSIPFAIAARLARPQAPIVATLGDGTFGFHAMELDTAMRYGIPFVLVVGNDAAWNAEYQIQLRDYGPDRLLECELLPSRYDRVAAALGGHGTHVTSLAELGPMLRSALYSGLPACVNVSISRHPAPAVRR